MSPRRPAAGCWIRTCAPSLPGRHNWYGNLVVARLLEAQGDLTSALAAVRRRPFRGRLTPSFLSTFLQEEARLAGQVGDTDGAARAYERLRVLRPATGEHESPPHVLDGSAGEKGHREVGTSGNR